MISKYCRASSLPLIDNILFLSIKKKKSLEINSYLELDCLKCIFNQTKAQPPLVQDATPDSKRISQNLHATKRLDGAVTPLSIIINIDIFPVSQISIEDVMGVELIAE